MQRPLLKVAVFYATGILVGEFLRVPLPWLLAACAVAAVGTLVWRRARPRLLAILFLLVGLVNTTWRTSITSHADLRSLIGENPQIVSVRGKLSTAPAEHIFERHHEEQLRTVAYVDVSEIAHGTNWQRAIGQLIVMTPGVLGNDFYHGQNVQIAGVIVQPSGPFADGLFDSKSFLKRKGIYYQLRVSSTNDWQIAGTPTPLPLSDRFFNYAKKTLAIGLPEEDLALRLMWTLVLDWKAPMTTAVEEPFVRAGTFHIFAVDGLRIGLITMMFVTLLQVLQVPRRWAGVLAVACIWFYTGLTGFPASAIRAAIMATIVIGGWIVKRPSDLMNSLFAAALIILVWEPQQLFQPGFQLSFVVVLCILLTLPMIHEWLKKPFVPDPLLPRQISSQQFWHGDWIAYPRSFVIDSFAISLAAWLGSIPLAAFYFHVFNIVSTPANFVVVPMTMFALISSLGSLLTGAWFPWMASLFNHATWFLMKGIIIISDYAVHWRPAAINVSAPSPLTTIWYYALLLALLTGWIFRTKHKHIAIVALSCLTVGCFVQWLTPNPIKLHVLPLGGGQCVLVDSGGVKTDLLIDSGDEQNAERVTKPFLQTQGVNWIDSCCLSVAHVNAMGGVEVVQTNFDIGRLVTSATRNRSVVYKRAMAKFDQTPDVRKLVKRGDRLSGWTV
ncbi:MAG: ComEC/Rec2-related protein, partial [Verrucomicrobiales bacterium]|nr:ComEC/Rec2-related protein [Verrucomicrobiales bacterium]